MRSPSVEREELLFIEGVALVNPDNARPRARNVPLDSLDDLEAEAEPLEAGRQASV